MDRVFFFFIFLVQFREIVLSVFDRFSAGCQTRDGCLENIEHFMN